MVNRACPLGGGDAVTPGLYHRAPKRSKMGLYYPKRKSVPPSLPPIWGMGLIGGLCVIKRNVERDQVQTGKIHARTDASACDTCVYVWRSRLRARVCVCYVGQTLFVALGYLYSKCPVLPDSAIPGKFSKSRRFFPPAQIESDEDGTLALLILVGSFAEGRVERWKRARTHNVHGRG